MYADPIGGEGFYGRTDNLALLTKRIAGLKSGYRQNVALVGAQFIGKTSLLLRLLDAIDDPEVMPVYVQVRAESLQRFGTRFLGAVLHFHLKRQGIAPPDGFRELAEAAKQSAPRTAEAALRTERLLRKGREQAFAALFDILPVVSEETGCFCVVMLDEFQEMSSVRLKNPFDIFGQKIMTQKQVMYIVTSSTIQRGKQILGQDLSLLFGNFEVDTLQPFCDSASREFLDARLPPARLGDMEKRFLIAITGGHPFYLGCLIGRMRAAAAGVGSGELSRDLVIDVLVDELGSAPGLLYRVVHGGLGAVLNGPAKAPDLEIVLSLAGGSMKSSEVARSMNRTPGQTTRRLDRLAHTDLVTRRAKLYGVSDPLQKLWLHGVYRVRESCYGPSMEESREAFRNVLKEMLDAFSGDEARGVPERIRELFRQFGNEVFEIGGKSLRLPRFDLVEAGRVNGAELPVVARAGKKRLWVADVQTGLVSEKEMQPIAERMGELDARVARKILVCLGGVEMDAKLIAQEAGLSLWSLDDVNFLLDLYGRCRIVM